MIPLHRVAGLLYNRALFITPTAAQTISDVLQRHIDARLTGSEVVEERHEREPRNSAFVGEPLKNADGGRTPFRVTRDGAAIMTIDGELVNRGSWIGADSGLVSYEGIKHQLSSAVADPRVKSIVLDINSPGGEAAGAFDVAAAVRKAAASKRVTAVLNNMAASAGYAIAAGATEIVVPQDGIGGSIGTLLMHLDISHALQNRGVKPTLIFAGAHKVDGNPFEALPKEVRDDMQAEVNKFYGLFVDSVAAGRKGMTPEAIRATEARIYIGQDLVDVGLADRVATFDDVIGDHAAKNTAPPMIGTTSPRVAATTQTKEKSMFTPEFKKSLGLAETATDAEVQATVDGMKAAAARTVAAEKDSKRVIANAQVDAWEREGIVSGNATAKVREVYVAAATGETVTPEMVAGMVAALPKLDTTRLSAVAAPSKESQDVNAGAGTVTLDDFAKAATDAKASQKIAAVIAERQKTNPKFTRDDLRRELEQKK